MTGAKAGFAAIVVSYPLIVYFGLEHFDVRLIAIFLVAMALLRLFLVRTVDGLSAAMPHARLVVVALLAFGVLAFVTNVSALLQYYPVVMNILMFAFFFGSLLRPPSAIEQFARITNPDLPEAGIAYTRKVTMLWCGFFVLNGAMAFYTVLGTSLGFWAIYNSVISYSLMGVLFAGEFLVRRVVQRREAASAGSRGWQ